MPTMLPGSSQGVASASHLYVITTHCDRQYACAMPMYGALNCGRKDAARRITMKVNCLRPIGHASRTKERPSAVGETERPQHFMREQSSLSAKEMHEERTHHFKQYDVCGSPCLASAAAWDKPVGLLLGGRSLALEVSPVVRQ